MPIFGKRQRKEYGRGQWQIDAHSTGGLAEVWSLNTIEELKKCPIVRISQKLYSMYSKYKTYDYNRHIKLTEELDKAEENSLANFFGNKSVSSNSDYVWDDINVCTH